MIFYMAYTVCNGAGFVFAGSLQWMSKNIFVSHQLLYPLPHRSPVASLESSFFSSLKKISLSILRSLSPFLFHCPIAFTSVFFPILSFSQLFQSLVLANCIISHVLHFHPSFRPKNTATGDVRFFLCYCHQ